MAEDARAALAGLPGLLAARLGVTAAAEAVAQAHETVRLLGGTRYRAFSPSDTCPDNNLVTSRGVRFVDFEWGCFRDIVLDAAYFRVPFPACEASFALPPKLAGGAAGGVAQRDRRRLAGARRAGAAAATSARRPAAVGVAVHLVAVAAAAGPGVRGRDTPIGPDAARSPRISTALAHYWRELGAAATEHGRASDGRARRGGRRGSAQAVPRRAGGARGLPRPALGGLTGDRGRQAAGLWWTRHGRPASIWLMSARVQPGQTNVTAPSRVCSLLQAIARAPSAARCRPQPRHGRSAVSSGVSSGWVGEVHQPRMAQHTPACPPGPP